MDLHRTTNVIESGIAAGLHHGAQVVVWRGGELIADLAIGEIRPGMPMRRDTLMPWRSAGKPIGAIAIAQLLERGKLQLDEAVAKHIPEFGVNGKEGVTLRHLLTHTAGLRHVMAAWSRDPWDKITQRIFIARAEPRWISGEKAGYHAHSTWMLLGEILQRVDGRSFESYVHEEIFLPLGMVDSYFALSEARYHSIGDRMGILAAEQDSAAGASMCQPGSSGRGPMRDLARFYRFLLQPVEPILKPQTARLFTTPQRVGMFDHTFKHVIDWGLGFIVNSQPYDPSRPYGFGPYASPRTFGHGGSQSSVGFADPDHELAVAIVFSGTPGEQKHQERMVGTLTALYEDLGIIP